MTTCHRFGMGGGRHRRKRKVNQGKRVRRHVYVYKSKLLGPSVTGNTDSSTASQPLNKLVIMKKRVLKHIPKPLQSKPKTPDVFRMVRSGEGLKFRLNKVSSFYRSGYRFINLDQLQNHVAQLSLHACRCPQAISLAAKGISPIKLETELRTFGLASVLQAKCAGCGYLLNLETSKRIDKQNCNYYDINVRAVWGCMATGNGAAHLTELLGTMDSPSMTRSTFSKIENDISQWWKEVLDKEMCIAGEEERNLAIERSDFHQGVPAITVVADGGWSKRTHKHTYNASGGVAIIIGHETKKLLHIGVRNKYCYVCSTAQNNRKDPPPHTCYKNWSESSQAMEADIITEGFKVAEQQHGIRYMRLIADGDSSVYAKIQEEVPIWGKGVVKLECANHSCKCLRSSLERLVEANPHYKGRNKLSKNTRVKLVSAVRCAIRMRSSGQGRDSVRLLEHDIRNSIHHVFGNHDHCSDFCKAHEGHSTEKYEDAPMETCDMMDDVLNDQVKFWQEGSSYFAQEDSRKGSDHCRHDLDDRMLADVSILLQRLAAKASRLVGNLTTNLCESWMHVRSKFDGGKVSNLCNRGSWHARCYGAGVRINVGPQWSPTVWERSTGTPPGQHFTKVFEESSKNLQCSIVSKQKPEQKSRRWNWKMKCSKHSTSQKARESYGPQAVDVVPDIDKADLESKQAKFIQQHINISAERKQEIKKYEQGSTAWKCERKKRLTASNFGRIVKRNPKIPVTPLVKDLLYRNWGGNEHTVKGLTLERITKQEYILKKAEENVNVTVKDVGLCISNTHPFLAATPDGIVREVGGCTGLLEMKNLLLNKPINLTEAAKLQKSFCLEIVNGNLQLKKQHAFYYQCQGQMNVCNSPWLDFVVRTTNPYQLHVERIYIDKVIWEREMLSKLHSFYYKAILPELAAPRKGLSPGIREPGVWFECTRTITKRKITSNGKSRQTRKQKRPTVHVSDDTDSSW